MGLGVQRRCPVDRAVGGVQRQVATGPCQIELVHDQAVQVRIVGRHPALQAQQHAAIRQVQRQGMEVIVAIEQADADLSGQIAAQRLKQQVQARVEQLATGGQLCQVGCAAVEQPRDALRRAGPAAARLGVRVEAVDDVLAAHPGGQLLMPNDFIRVHRMLLNDMQPALQQALGQSPTGTADHRRAHHHAGNVQVVRQLLDIGIQRDAERVGQRSGARAAVGQQPGQLQAGLFEQKTVEVQLPELGPDNKHLQWPFHG